MANEFVPGQRWVVDSEPELGLGRVVSIDARAVKMDFPLAETERLYAINRAPLTRIAFDVGDEIHLGDGGSAKVVAVHEHAGVLIYDIGTDQLVPESALAGAIRMSQPFLRLMTGQLDKARWFSFRRRLDSGMARVWQSRLSGLLGTRAQLIPHQLFVAYQACQRDPVRVLLADEVGLGKTIEAGMILARMVLTERVRRVLVIVPDALQVQWLVELIRRFNLRPEIYGGAEHDYQSGQIHLVPHHALSGSAGEKLEGESFDMVIVDEAHHLLPGSEVFERLRQFAQTAPHMLLLSATPEQLGVESHFARLQLLDGTKFSSLEQFLELEQGYARLNEQIKRLPESRQALIERYDLNDVTSDQQLVERLLDYHGTGRMMFRNTRSAIKGFPPRVVEVHPLVDDSWPTRFEWLAQWLRQQAGEKVLTICHRSEDALACEQYLWQKHGIDVALFHEDMDLIERDRAAAYFADMEHGCAVLVCSEIGSEGRNFQFSHHLVCLDLPAHPDLLEQRIGRLDRIGQNHPVHIHIPFAEGSENQQRMVWFHEVLDCVGRQNPAAGAVHDELQPWSAAAGQIPEAELYATARARSAFLEAEIQQGRDALLELNSCRQPAADQLRDQVSDIDKVDLFALVEEAADLLNFHFEESRGGAWSLIPADNMLIPALPGIPPEGADVAFDRALANARDDAMFISWDSPFVRGLWELLRHSDLGAASVALLPGRQLPPGQCLLETTFDLIVQSPVAGDCLPFLQELSVRTLVLDVGDRDLSTVLPEATFDQSVKPVDKKLARRIVQSRKEQIPVWYHKAEAFATVRKDAITTAAQQQAAQYYASEIERLERLAQAGAQPDAGSVNALRSKAKQVENALNKQVQMQLSAIRLVVTTEPGM